ncbi:MAG: NosD domain-containing protein, partial [Candidatus Zixiibacteriota bacterium]
NDGGWVAKTATSLDGGKSYVLGLYISDNGNIYAGGVRIKKSTDDGSTFNNFETGHDDTRDMIFPNGDDNLIYIVNDGGPVIPNSSSYDSKCGDICLMQINNVGISDKDPDVVIGGGNDIGVWLTRENNYWKKVFGIGDGGSVEISRVDASIIYGSYGSHTPVSLYGALPTSLVGFDTQVRPYRLGSPLVSHPSDAEIVFSDHLNSSSGNQPEILANDVFGNTVVNWDIVDKYYYSVYDIGISFSNPERIVSSRFGGSTSGIEQGRFRWTSDNGSTPWQKISSVDNTYCSIEDLLNTAPTSDIEFHPFNKSLFWMTFSRFVDGEKVYLVNMDLPSSGTCPMTFTNITYNLENIPVNCICYDDLNGRLYLGTDYGIYFMDDGTTSWVYDESFQPIIVSDIRINHQTNEMVISTWGRGFWKAKLPCDHKSTPVEITQNQTWDYDRWYDRDIVVKSGYQLTIKSTVYLSAGSGITVENGARLIIDNGRITSHCNLLWKGITVLGTPFLNQMPFSNQGYIQLKNNAVIENAEKAIVAKGGAVVRAQDCTFRNNRYDVWFEQYHSPSYPLMNYSYFTSCNFVTEGQLVDPSKYPINHLRLYKVSGINIKNCLFSNDRNGLSFPNETGPLYANLRGIGIYAYESDFKVIPDCATIQPYGVPCPSPLQNRFEGLYYGIKANSGNPACAVTIQESLFSNNYRGILLENLNCPTVILNEINADYTWAGTDLYQQFAPPFGNSTYGMYLNQCTGYRVEENIFENGDAGLFIYNSGTNSN